jgi:hypothetical protein
MATLSIKQYFGGVPFLDDTFDAQRLLGAVIASRAHRLGAAAVEALGKHARVLLSPRVIRDSLWKDVGPDIRSGSLPSSAQHMLQDTIDAIRARRPAWAPLLALPVEFRELHEPGPISCSCFSWPQHVFLAPEAFASTLELTEQVIHELSHNWLYLIEELVPLHPATANASFTLPSGTSHRDIAEVIGAACVAGTLVRWYAGQADPRAPARAVYLQTYLDGCLAILRGLPPGALTEVGVEIRDALQRATPAGTQ